MALNEIQKKERSEYLETELKITECSQMKPYAFISYASDNWETVFKSVVVPMQKQYGLRVYADKAFDKVNDKWIVPMLRNVRGSDVVIAFISQSYIESYACFLELLTAVNNKKQIVFVSLEEKLHLGDTTDLPDVERGVKNEILNQGANIATNTNNTSNDIMRAMKSAYTSLSTLLEQDALSKYDISDAFINFFRDASINRKSINDLGAVRRTIKSVSRSVFDKSLIVGPASAVQPAVSVEQSAPQPAPVEQPQPLPSPQPAPVEQPKLQSESESAPVEQPKPQPEPESVPAEEQEPQSIPEPVLVEESRLQPEPEPAPVEQPEPQPKPEPVPVPDSHPVPQEDSVQKKTKGLTGRARTGVIAGCAAVVLLLIMVFVVGGTKKVTDVAYTLSDGSTGTYTGEWKKDMPEGQGTLTFAEDNENGWESYEGEWKEGERNGQGTLKWTNGKVYEGEFVNGEHSGKGTMTWEDENGSTIVYEGDFQSSLFSGKGTITWKEGEEVTGTYEGDFADGWINGYGTYSWPSGMKYEGEVENGRMHGKGTLTYSDGSVFVGEFVHGQKNGEATYTKDGTVVTENWINGKKVETLTLDDGTYTGSVSDGKPDGEGTMEYTNGDVYEGEWKDGMCNGQGIIKYANDENGCESYEGGWENNLYNGHGVMKWNNGDIHEGEYKDGDRNGQGVMKWNSGDTYEGEYKDGNRNGRGIYKCSDGRIYDGEWKDNKFSGEGTYTDADGNVTTGTWVDGKYADTAFGAPADFTAVANPDDPAGVRLEWSAVNGAAGYQTCFFEDAEHKKIWTEGDVVEGLVYSWYSMTNGSTYYMGVRAVKEENGETVYSDWSYVTYTHNP